MYKNQLQELAQRSCFNLPSYACTREGPDHAPRFKACVNFNGEVFESPIYSPTLRQAEHSAAEVALNVLSTRGPSSSLTARVLDETGVYKNLLQETAHRAGLKLPVYTTVRSGPGHVPVFTCNVELAGMKFSGEPAKTKKQAEKNAAIAAWSTLKTRPYLVSLFETSKYAAESSRDENQGGRMMMGMRGQSPKGKNIGGLCTSKLRNYPHNDQQRNLLNPNYSPSSSATTSTTCCNLYEVGGGSGISSSSTCNKKQSTSLGSSSFVSLLPPPKPRTTSKILPPELVQVKMQEVLDEHQRDEDEWLRGSKCSNPPHAYNNRSSRRGFSIQGAIPEGNFRQVGGLKYKNIFAKGMAPAVQIRSVIPVCAAAPARAPQPHQDLPLVVEEDSGADANKNDDASAIH